MINRRIVFFLRRWALLFVFLIMPIMLVNVLFNESISKNGIAIGLAVLVWTIYAIHDWSKKRVIEYHIDDFLSDIPEVIHPIFLKYDFSKYKSSSFVSKYLKQEIFDELKLLREKHEVKTHGTNFDFDINEDDTFGSKKIEVVVEGEILNFRIWIQLSGSKCAVYEIEKQPNALSINMKLEK